MHMHQQNHWNRVLFYWYQSYHWHQWTISLTNRIRLCLLDMCVRTRSSSAVWCPWHFSQFVLYPRCMEVRLLVGHAKLQRDQYLVKHSRVTPTKSLQWGQLLIARTPVKETPDVRVTIFTFRAKCASLTAIPRRRNANELRFYMEREGMNCVKLCTPSTLSVDSLDSPD